MTTHRDEDVSLQVCPCCNGEGRLTYDTGMTERETGCPIEEIVTCEECNGTGGALVPTEPLAVEDVSPLTPLAEVGLSEDDEIGEAA